MKVRKMAENREYMDLRCPKFPELINRKIDRWRFMRGLNKEDAIIALLEKATRKVKLIEKSVVV